MKRRSHESAPVAGSRLSEPPVVLSDGRTVIEMADSSVEVFAGSVELDADVVVGAAVVDGSEDTGSVVDGGSDEETGTVVDGGTSLVVIVVVVAFTVVGAAFVVVVQDGSA